MVLSICCVLLLLPVVVQSPVEYFLAIQCLEMITATFAKVLSVNVQMSTFLPMSNFQKRFVSTQCCVVDAQFSTAVVCSSAKANIHQKLAISVLHLRAAVHQASYLLY